ncbi:hypothetical protein L1987_50685 [Smallanthus sonchifolius]|uniref:Uncharacterized protein n=1 Tax=Smallanthus sonchifolius TaxID=185202 RepID=A0ACB9EN74_9ASTR|nr:hypothetical protein L1987_50685 [Smallanthus sonchifolius]
MAVFFLFLALTSLVLQSSPAHSLNCSSEKFTNKKVYSNCTDLPTLKSTLHWTYSRENSSLSIAFTAPPATPNGWIAWAINPTQTAMAGCQTLIAFKDSNGSMAVKTYNISSYSSIVEGKIAFEVPESSAEFSGGVMMIFATVKLPETMTEVNHVWQVGGSVTDGRPGKHEFLPANLMAMGKLQLVGEAKSNVTTAGSPAVAPSTNSASRNAGIFGVVTVIGCLLGFF